MDVNKLSKPEKAIRMWWRRKRNERFQSRLAEGRESYGRQDASKAVAKSPQSDTVEPVKAPLHPAITARVFRAATQTWEGLEVTEKEIN